MCIRDRAIIAVHLYGQAADLNPIITFCKSNKIYLIEDASQAHGAKYNNKRVGSIGDIGCFSCYPTKNLGAIGDAGLVTSNNHELASKMRMIREYGWQDRVSIQPGRNSRLDELQATILRIKLKHLDEDNQKRRDIAEFYYEKLSELPILLPSIRANAESVFHLFVIQVEDRNSLLSYLKKGEIIAGVHYSLPVHMHPAYNDRVIKSEDMVVTENVVNKIISLPIYPELSKSDVNKIVNRINQFYNH